MSTTVSAFVLVGLGVYGFLTFGWRSYVQWRRTGSTGFRGISGRAWTSAEWWGGVSFVVALVATAATPVAYAAGFASIDVPLALRAGGVSLFAAGGVLTVVSQLHMGDAWRIGVDAQERTTLVRSGVFAVVRNPIFTSMFLAVCGVALIVPNACALVAVASLFVALELQVRLVEEPYLRRTHGDAYAHYAASVGRFVPRLGLLRR